MKRRGGTVKPKSFCQSDIDLEVMKPVEEREMADLRREAALRSVWVSIVWSRVLFLTHFKRTLTRFRRC